MIKAEVYSLWAFKQDGFDVYLEKEGTQTIVNFEDTAFKLLSIQWYWYGNLFLMITQSDQN